MEVEQEAYSKTPRRILVTSRPAKFCTMPVKVMIIPQEVIRIPR
jgi:hypothetical protein